MVKYKRIFLKYYGLSEYDTIMCWYCEHIRAKEIGVAVDIHHVESKSKSPHLVNEISNMFAICRKHHEDYKVIFREKETLKNIVKEKMKHGK